ncbi:GntR family transcriptional regulator [Streptomyces sp. NPDC048606]|uniref:GntR family transcriptional regulator n=1 Tax=Streptomyces sp. NPDC048606 TaxID=3154726 RepID=UPI00343E268E
MRVIAATWTPTALTLQTQAHGSAVDQARWQKLIGGVDPSRVADSSPEAVTELATAVIDLLTALDDGPTPIAHLAAAVSSAIGRRHYEPGMFLTTAAVATHLAAPKHLVRDALAHLTTEGTLVRSGCHITVALAGQRPCPTPDQLAARIREQLAHGIHRPGDDMPSLKELGRLLRTGQARIAEAQDMLEREGLLLRQRRRGPRVLDSAQSLTPCEQLPLPAPPRQRTGLSVIRTSTEAAKRRWQLRAYLAPDEVREHWDKLRVLDAQLLSEPFPTGVTPSARLRADARTAQAIEALCAPLPDGILPGLWHTACLATALGDLLPQTTGTTAEPAPKTRRSARVVRRRR